MLTSKVLVEAASVRHLFNRFGALTLLSSLATLGLFPLLLRPVLAGNSRIVLFFLLLAYLSRKAVEWTHTERSVRQIRTEAAFIGQRLSDAKLTGCLERNDTIWSRSLTLGLLRKESNRPFSGLLLLKEEQQRMRHLAHHTFLHLPTSYPILDLVLWNMLLWAATAFAGTTPWTSGWVIALASVALMLELVALIVRWRLRRRLTRLEHAFADWVLNSATKIVMPLRHGTAYAHTVLYRSPPWFAMPKTSSA